VTHLSATGLTFVEFCRVLSDSLVCYRAHIQRALSDSLVCYRAHIQRFLSDSLVCYRAHIQRVLSDSLVCYRAHIQRVLSDSLVCYRAHIQRVLSNSLVCYRAHIQRDLSLNSGQTYVQFSAYELKCSPTAHTKLRQCVKYQALTECIACLGRSGGTNKEQASHTQEQIILLCCVISRYSRPIPVTGHGSP
jgi:hypothetical protein